MKGDDEMVLNIKRVREEKEGHRNSLLKKQMLIEAFKLQLETESLRIQV